MRALTTASVALPGAHVGALYNCAASQCHLSHCVISNGIGAVSGCIGWCAGLAACSVLQHLDIAGNRLRSLEGLSGCGLLQTLAADGNMLDAFPSQQHLPTGLLLSLSLKANRCALQPRLHFTQRLHHASCTCVLCLLGLSAGLI